MSDFKATSCGHLHPICPQGHAFAGLPACDNEAWGAYAFGAVFAKGAAAASTGPEQAKMEADFADSFSRLLVDKKAWANGDFGMPDLSSEGVKD